MSFFAEKPVESKTPNSDLFGERKEGNGGGGQKRIRTKTLSKWTSTVANGGREAVDKGGRGWLRRTCTMVLDKCQTLREEEKRIETGEEQIAVLLNLTIFKAQKVK